MSKSIAMLMPRTARGMSLIELMIVVAIVGILAGIAYPSYRQQIIKGARTDGKVELMRASQSLEKCYTMFGAYNNANCAVLAGLNAGVASEGGKYQVSLSNITATTYTLQAVPQDGQAADARCATLSLDSTGLRTHSGTAAAVDDCW